MAPGQERPGEFELIARYFRPLAPDPHAFALGDDAATLPAAPGEDWVVTMDVVAEGVHFLPGDPPASIAKKALRVNLSDLAAKGATPAYYTMALALRADWTEAWLAGFAEGLAADQAEFGVTLLGGDTTAAAGGTTIAITAFGRVPAGRMVHRSGARPGDAIFVSGTVGDAALGLTLRREGRREGHLVDRYLHPQPRTRLAPAISRFASAALDVSDGLAADLGHICRASGVDAEVAAESVPLSPPAREALDADPGLLAAILSGGDDYEILATVPPSSAEAFAAAAGQAGVAVSRIGRIPRSGGKARFLGSDGRAIALGKAGHVHFRG
jgi:thiamine-monophosphate kinase